MADTPIAYRDLIALFSAVKESGRESVPLEEWVGLPVHYDAALPPNVVELRDVDGRVIQRFDWPE